MRGRSSRPASSTGQGKAACWAKNSSGVSLRARFSSVGEGFHSPPGFRGCSPLLFPAAPAALLSRPPFLADDALSAPSRLDLCGLGGLLDDAGLCGRALVVAPPDSAPRKEQSPQEGGSSPGPAPLGAGGRSAGGGGGGEEEGCVTSPAPRGAKKRRGGGLSVGLPAVWATLREGEPGWSGDSPPALPTNASSPQDPQAAPPPTDPSLGQQGASSPRREGGWVFQSRQSRRPRPLPPGRQERRAEQAPRRGALPVLRTGALPLRARCRGAGGGLWRREPESAGGGEGGTP